MKIYREIEVHLEEEKQIWRYRERQTEIQRDSETKLERKR